MHSCALGDKHRRCWCCFCCGVFRTTSAVQIYRFWSMVSWLVSWSGLVHSCTDLETFRVHIAPLTNWLTGWPSSRDDGSVSHNLIALNRGNQTTHVHLFYSNDTLFASALNCQIVSAQSHCVRLPITIINCRQCGLLWIDFPNIMSIIIIVLRRAECRQKRLKVNEECGLANISRDERWWPSWWIGD